MSGTLFAGRNYDLSSVHLVLLVKLFVASLGLENVSFDYCNNKLLIY